MMPNNGKILIVDDNYNEALPLIKMLSKAETPYMYFSGSVDELPDKPFLGIRIVFFDLRYTTSTGDRDVVGNAINLIRRLIDKANGPFILIVWSKHEVEYFQLLCDELIKNSIHPEFVLPLTKSDYFETETDLSEQFEEHTNEVLQRQLGEDIKNDAVVGELSLFLQGLGCFDKKNIKPDAITMIGERLKCELEKANLFALFVLWENTINCAKSNTVNEIYQQMPNSIPKDKLLAAMLYYMASYRLEKNTDESSTQVKFEAAIDTLNEMFYYFYRDETYRLSVDQIPNLLITKDSLFENNVKPEKYNRWIMTTTPSLEIAPGNVYKDLSRIFVPHGLISGSDKAFSSNQDEFYALPNNIFVFVEISADCDIAQKKRVVSKIIPGVLVFEDDLKRLISERKFKDIVTNKAPEYIRTFEPFELEVVNEKSEKELKIMRLIFNLNMATFRNLNEIKSEDLVICIRKSFVTNLQTELGKLISRQGIANF